MLVNFFDNKVLEMLNYVLFIAQFRVMYLLLVIKFEVILVNINHDFVGRLLFIFWYTDAIEDSVLEQILSSWSKIRIELQHFLQDTDKLRVRFVENFLYRLVSTQLLLVRIPFLLADQIQLF